ncbi:uncharacterized protein LOC118190392, partial [Stegodyphus dumicola]|uniref:uncharacterized protein LOC118190392 n=1 Tax=Stegodyphus dumicola TaxID=202533 RepID=UPI0015B19193
MRSLEFFCILFCISLIYITYTPSAAQQQKIGQPLFCHGCVATLKELHKVLRDSSGRKKAVAQSLDRLCQINNFVSYTFSPPKMIKACNYIVGKSCPYFNRFYVKCA